MDVPLWLQVVLQLLLQFFLIFLNAVFACAEIAVIEIKGTKLDKLAEDGNKKARALKKLVDRPEKFLSTIQVAITLSGFLASAFAAENFSVYIVNALSGKIGMSDGLINTISVILITLLLSYITLVLGELVPKRLAIKNPTRASLALTGPVRVASVIFAPLVKLLSLSTNAVLRLMKIDPHADESDVSEEDIRMMADAGSESGSIDEEANEMIQNVFEFDDITVGEISTHRTEIVALFQEDSDEDWAKTIDEEIHTFYPVVDEDLDHIVGLLVAEKYFRLKDKSRASVMANAVEKPKYVAQVMKADMLFKEMKKEQTTIAIVVDEYGGTYGIITLNDLIEEIVGDFNETEDDKEIYIKESGDGYLISGLSEKESFEELFDIDLESDAATVGGWVTEKLEQIPDEKDEFVFNNIKVVVTKVSNTRVLEIYAEKLPDETEAESEEEKEDSEE
ncbi:MAG: hemolysin family protein [Clostridiales bacterium]|nr:hemolysin family protein [Clostridiales bacterium]